MQSTVHEAILDYMTLSENEGQSGYLVLKKAAQMGWYSLYKKTKESIVKKWMPVTNGVTDFPMSMETLFGCYIVDTCGDLQPLFEDNKKNIIPIPKAKCGCTQCDVNECLCPTVQPSLIQTPVVIEGVTYTNKYYTQLLKNGDVVEESEIWYPDYNGSSQFIGATKIPSQRTVCQVDTLPCGCAISSEENAKKLLSCGCVCEWDAPYLREQYPAVYNEFGYYKKSDETRKIHLFNSRGKKSNLSQILLVYESNGEDMVIPQYALMCFLALLNYYRMMFSPSYTRDDREGARRQHKREEFEMLKYLNPIPYALISNIGPYYKTYRPYHTGVHSDFVNQQPALPPPCNVPVQNITNIIGSGKPPFIGVVGAGGEKDPVANLATFSHPDLKNLGLSNGFRIKIEIDDVTFSNFGQNKSFDYDPTTGTITFINEYKWQIDSTLWVNLNQ